MAVCFWSYCTNLAVTKLLYDTVGCSCKHDVVVFDAFENLGLAEVDVGNRRRSHILRASKAKAMLSRRSEVGGIG